MAASFNGALSPEDRDAIARKGDMGVVACAIRVAAARLAVDLTLGDFAEAAGLTPGAIANAEAARCYPSRRVMQYLYRSHGIDFNFLLHGDTDQLERHLRTRVLRCCLVAERALDQRLRSNPSPGARRGAPATS